MTLSAAMAEIKANPGKFYVYILLRHDGTPFYVGYAKVRTWNRQRLEEHERTARFPKSVGHKNRIIQKMFRDGIRPLYQIDSWHEIISLAHSREIYLIRTLGRVDKGAGPLVNLTDGGEGTANISARHLAGIKAAAGRKWSDEARISFSMKCMGRKHSSESIEKTRKANTGKKRSAASIELTRQKHLGMRRSPEFCDLQSANRKGRKPPTVRSCEIMGVEYQTLSAAAVALSTRPSTIFHWIRRGVRGSRYIGERVIQGM
jgi:hypothetical protein